MTSPSKPLDIICMGRVAVDFYAEQIGARLEDAGSFNKYLGGSSGNVAYGAARQGLKSSMLARVGNEHMGRFLREELERVGVDTSYLITDADRLTALVILGIKDQDTFPLIFYRDNCADMAITRDDIDEDYIASARAITITGTHLSNPQTREAVLTALDYATQHQLKRCLDIDYRPVLWGLTDPGDGETRYIANQKISDQLQQVLHYFDLVVGTEEEFHIAGGTTDTVAALRKVREHTNATLVCKRGALGCSVFEHEVPNTLDEGLTVYGVKVAVLNVLGAGDAFMSGLLRGYLNDEGWHQSCRYANACGALVVSRHGCSPAMPSMEELDYYLAHDQEISRPDIDPVLNHLHRTTTRDHDWQELNLLAFDHRIQLEKMAADCGADINRIPQLKALILNAIEQTIDSENLGGKVGAFVDSTFGQDTLNAISGRGWWLARPIEQPGSRPLQLEHGNIGTQLRSWPLEQIVKCLVFYHPDDNENLRQQQESLIMEVYAACCQSGHEFLLELILPAGMPSGDDYYLRAIERVYQLDVKPDWWKLPPMAPQSWNSIETTIDENDPHCQGVVILGLDAPEETLAQGFKDAANCRRVKGFAVGRTIFGKAAQSWLANTIDDDEFVQQIQTNYRRIIHLWRNRQTEA